MHDILQLGTQGRSPMRFITALMGGSASFRLWLQRRERGSTLWGLIRTLRDSPKYYIRYIQQDRRISRPGIWKGPVRPPRCSCEAVCWLFVT